MTVNHKGYTAISDKDGTRIYNKIGEMIHSSKERLSKTKAEQRIDEIIKTNTYEGYNHYLDNWAKRFFPEYEWLWDHNKFYATKVLNMEMERLYYQAKMFKEISADTEGVYRRVMMEISEEGR